MSDHCAVLSEVKSNYTGRKNINNGSIVNTGSYNYNWSRENIAKYHNASYAASSNVSWLECNCKCSKTSKNVRDGYGHKVGCGNNCCKDYTNNIYTSLIEVMLNFSSEFYSSQSLGKPNAGLINDKCIMCKKIMNDLKRMQAKL